MTAAPSRRNRPGKPVRREGAARSNSSRAAGTGALGALAHAMHLDPADANGLGRLPAEKHLRVAPKVSRRVLTQRRRARWAVAGLAAISAASMFLLVTFHVFAVQSSFQLDKLEQQRSAAQRRNELLRNQVAKSSSATTIFNAALALGMKRPTQTILVNVSGADATLPKPERASVKMPEPLYGQTVAAAP